MMTFSGYPNFRYHDETDPVSSCYQMSGYILVDDEVQGQRMINNLNLKINQFERMITSKGGFSGIKTYQHVNFDLKQDINDQMAFDIIGLTQQEVDMVTVKVVKSNT
jgi:hypothetical protein